MVEGLNKHNDSGLKQCIKRSPRLDPDKAACSTLEILGPIAHGPERSSQSVALKVVSQSEGLGLPRQSIVAKNIRPFLFPIANLYSSGIMYSHGASVFRELLDLKAFSHYYGSYSLELRVGEKSRILCLNMFKMLKCYNLDPARYSQKEHQKVIKQIVSPNRKYMQTIFFSES